MVIVERQSKLNSEDQTIFDVLNSKEIRCRGCNGLIHYDSDMYEKYNDNYVATMKKKGFHAFSNGMSFICDKCETEDDISWNYAVLKNKLIVNMQDFFENHIFPVDGDFEAILKAFGLIIDRK